MSDTLVLPGDPPITIALRRSAQARRLSLRVSRIDGTVRMTVPRGGSRRMAQAFAAEKESWLRAQIAVQPQVCHVDLGIVLPIEGQERIIQVGAVKRATLTDDALILPQRRPAIGPRVAAWAKELARDRLAAASDHYAGALGRSYGRLTLRDTRSRWGSCTSAGDLMYSWRLILTPPEILRYVAAHEVAHLVEMNHGAGFWALVEQLDPNYRTHRAWLRTDGAALHRYDFKSAPRD